MGAHTKRWIQYHLVWIPKYRKRVLRGKIAIRLKKLLYEARRMNSWWISEVAIQDDHLWEQKSLPHEQSSFILLTKS
jgi:putative transposase